MLRFSINGEFKDRLDMGNVIVGSSKTLAIDVKNEYSSAVDLENPYSNDPDITILNYPNHLEHGQTGSMTVEFSPKPDRKTPLNASFGFDVVVLA